MDIKLRADKWVTNNKDIKITDTDDGIKIEYFVINLLYIFIMRI